MTLPEKGKDSFQEPGYELIKQQLFFRKELIERVHWFIRVRWFAVGGAVAGAWVLHLLEPKFPVLPLTLIALSIFVYNLIFRAVCRRLDTSKGQEVRPFTNFAHIQISLDLLALYAMIYFTGGIYSPLLMFVIFHIIIAGLLLPPLACYMYSFSSLLATAALVGLVEAKILPEQPILLQSSLFPHLLLAQQSMKEIMLVFAFFGAAVLITAFLITTIRRSLWTKGQDLLKVSKELDVSNAKLTALYEVVKRMGLCSELQELLDLATRSVANLMGIKGASIKLLDETRKKLIFASNYGLSENYLAKGVIDIEKSPINRRIIEGSFVAMGRIDEEDYFQYPEDIRKEGIASMVCLPLRVEKMPLGVFCMYSEISYNFSENDIKFFSLLSDLTALAIETLRGEINKTWFLQKAAHQLRSPFGAIYSLMKVLRKGYLGPVSEQQQDAILRCEKRLEMLGTMVNDLLKLGIKRQHADDRAIIHPVDGAKILRALKDLYESSASEKGVKIDFVIAESTPEVMADEKLLDELFGNLISNAIKYTPPGGEVRVALAEEREHLVHFEVSDTGIGILEEDIPRLFTEFFRAENAKALSEEGTGLGLAIVKEILDFLGGSISVKSKVGKGTTLTCLLPAV
ncbi:MAG: phosphate regulon sensor protein PhoR (SphS) [Deltaproteobacteria bacterium]|nr:phosphate regulon sensor protein PhoR (SphS) [Deltaproteobacteria bacterium]